MRSSFGREQAFTLLEMIAVLVILTILTSFATWGVMSSRRSGGHLLGVATARHYEQAIDRFAATHGGQVPQVDGVDWPSGGAEAGKGPVATIMGQRKYFLRGSTPESVSDGRVLVGVGTTPVVTGDQTTITYMIDGGGYRLEVRTPGKPACAIYGQGGVKDGAEPDPCGAT